MQNVCPRIFAKPSARLLAFGWTLVAFGGGCSQAWTFSRGEPLSTAMAVDNLPVRGPPAAWPIPGPTGPAVARASYQPPLTAPGAVPDGRPPYPGPAAAYPGPPETMAMEPMGPATRWPPASQPETLSPGVGPGPPWQPPPGWPMAPSSPDGNPPPDQPPQPAPVREPMLLAMWNREFPNVWCDYRNYYSWPTTIGMAAGLGIAAGVANSDLDGEIQTWYQKQIRSPESDRIAAFWRPFGQGQYTIPVVGSLMLLNDTGWLDDRPVLSDVGEWGDRVSRAYLVGAPPMLAMQYLTGGSRPSSTNSHSSWQPFSANNGVSGDAFMSSCLFISAADMTDHIALKGFYYACSFMVPWERVNNNQHFASQAALGWWMGYLACRAVDETETGRHPAWTVTPITSPEITGMGMEYRH